MLKDYLCNSQIKYTIEKLRSYSNLSADIHSDTRSLKEGDIFAAYAVRGNDNRKFVKYAIERKVSAIIYQPYKYINEINYNNLIKIPNLNKIIGEIASSWYMYPTNNIFVIAITGTNGKTSCSHWISSILTSNGILCGIIGSLGFGINNKLSYTGFTTPDASQLQRTFSYFRSLRVQSVSIEASSHALHQNRINGVKFDIAVFTNCTQDHLDYHKTIKEYESSKISLFTRKNLRYAVINRDDNIGRKIIKIIKNKVSIISYGINNNINILNSNKWITASNIQMKKIGTKFNLSTSDWGNAEIITPIFGNFNISNLLAVIGVLLLCKISLREILKELAKLKPIIGRMQYFGGRLKFKEPLVIIDYAHTPDALQKILEIAKKISVIRKGRLICIFGCGGNRDKQKRPIMGMIAEKLSDKIIITNDNPRNENPDEIINQIVSGIFNKKNLYIINNRSKAIFYSIQHSLYQDVIVIAGKGCEAYQEIMGKYHNFIDEDHVKSALTKRLI